MAALLLHSPLQGRGLNLAVDTHPLRRCRGERNRAGRPRAVQSSAASDDLSQRWRGVRKRGSRSLCVVAPNESQSCYRRCEFPRPVYATAHSKRRNRVTGCGSRRRCSTALSTGPPKQCLLAPRAMAAPPAHIAARGGAARGGRRAPRLPIDVERLFLSRKAAYPSNAATNHKRLVSRTVVGRLHRGPCKRAACRSLHPLRNGVHQSGERTEPLDQEFVCLIPGFRAAKSAWFHGM